MKQSGGVGWDRQRLEMARDDLARHELIEPIEGGHIHLTALGRLAGESAIEVESLLRGIDFLRAVSAEEVTDPALIVIAQASVELDAIYFPVNKKSTQKEPRYWVGQLQRQGISYMILDRLQQYMSETTQFTARAKKAVACLYYVAGISMEEIENSMGQFGGAFDGAAGPIRSVTARTCDVLPMIARAAEVLHPGIDLQQRTARLLTRLDLGIPSPAVDLAHFTGRDLDRADYRRLCEAQLTERETLERAEDATLLPLLGKNARKIAIVRDALERWRAVRPATPSPTSLPTYKQ